MLENFLYSSKYNLPFSVMINIFLPLTSTLLINPDCVSLLTNIVSREYDKFDCLRRFVTGVPT